MRTKRNLSKILSLALVFALLSSSFICLSFLSANAAADSLILVVSGGEGKQGDTVTIELSLAENPGIVQFRPKISFEKSKLELISVTNGSGILNSPAHAVNSAAITSGNTNGSFTFFWNDALAEENNTAVGKIATLVFKIKDYDAVSWPDTITLDVTILACADFDLDTVPYNVQSGGGVITVICDHTPGDWETTLAPTCTATGTKVKKCSICEEIIQSDSIPANGHSYGGWQTRTNETCTVDGLEYKTCSVCSDEDTHIIPATGHNIGDWETTLAPTCTETGTKVKKCTLCEEVMQSESIPSNGHSWGAWTEKTPPTFNTNGQEKRVCSVCDAEDTRSIAKLSDSHTHDFSGAETVVAHATCTAEGSKKVYCTESECGEFNTVTIPSTGHASGNWTAKTAATCTTDGLRVKKCTVCGDELETQVIGATGHSYGSWQVRTAAACTTSGLEYRTCSVCSHEDTHTIAATGHNAGNWETTLPPTCTATGTKIKRCTECSESLETETLNALGHSYSGWQTRTMAGCTTAGLEYRTCSACSHEDTRSISATGHIPGEWDITLSSTCTATGTKIKVCTICSETVQTETLNALGHSWSAWAVTIPAAFTTDGSEEHICSFCHEEETRRIPKLSETHVHDFSGTEHVDTHAACTEEGAKKVYCTELECGEFIAVSIPATGHTPGEWNTVKEATEHETGLKERKCAICGEVAATQIIPVIGTHTPVYPIITPFGTWNGSGGATVAIDGDFTKFVRLIYNGQAVDSANYTVTSGSTIITLKESYLKTLTNGTYVFTAEFNDGLSEMISLSINKTTNEDQNTAGLPITGENSNIHIWILFGSVSFATICGTVLVGRRKKCKAIK